MQLSIVIVNYKVPYFMEHCLSSVMAASKHIQTEVIVVDNASGDESVFLIQQYFPEVIVIANTTNVGFAQANNQGLAIAKGEYILYLNPDTILPEDALQQSINTLKANKNIGALGVRLIDGKGQYLPESKRGFPSLFTAFYKITGIYRLAPKHAVLNKYYMGSVSQHTSGVVDVLPGCFMLMPRDVINKVGGFSNDYFMYGEDIDLSYMVQQAGFNNYYLASTTIIHYKGESTKKGSLNYVRLFYQAMIIFAQKHFTSSKQKIYIPFIKIAIILRATLGVLVAALSKLLLPLLDACIMLLCLQGTKQLWLTYIKPLTNYTAPIIHLFFAIYILVWLVSIYFSGGYDTPLKKVNILKGISVGAIVILVVYGLLPESVRFSRGITLLGATSSAVCIWLIRWVLQALGVQQVKGNAASNNIMVVSEHAQSYNNVLAILHKAGVHKDVVGNICMQHLKPNDMGSITDISTLLPIHYISEVIFTYPDASYHTIISTMQHLGTEYNYKLYSQHALSIIGSNSKNTAGDLYTELQHYNIATAMGVRNKRMFDIMASLILILLYPIIIFILKNKKVLQQCLLVLLGKYTWCHYKQADNLIQQLPRIKQGVYEPLQHMPTNNTTAHQININYAKHYSIALDIRYMWQALSNL
jgi:O-antigen biosynthesis protein